MTNPPQRYNDHNAPNRLRSEGKSEEEVARWCEEHPVTTYHDLLLEAKYEDTDSW